MTLVDRKSRFTIVTKLRNKMVKEVNAHLIPIILKFGIKTITSDNGCEFHGFKEVEAATEAKFFFATPHHSWERGTSENTNGLIRQYLPKWMSMRHVTQAFCDFYCSTLERKTQEEIRLGNTGGDPLCKSRLVALQSRRWAAVIDWDWSRYGKRFSPQTRTPPVRRTAVREVMFSTFALDVREFRLLTLAQNDGP
jgi:hypothetical protein